MKVNISIEDNALKFQYAQQHESFNAAELKRLKKEAYCIEHFIDLAFEYISGILAKEHEFWEYSKEECKMKLAELYNKI